LLSIVVVDRSQAQWAWDRFRESHPHLRPVFVYQRRGDEVMLPAVEVEADPFGAEADPLPPVQDVVRAQHGGYATWDMSRRVSSGRMYG